MAANVAGQSSPILTRSELLARAGRAMVLARGSRATTGDTDIVASIDRITDTHQRAGVARATTASLRDDASRVMAGITTGAEETQGE